MASAQTRCGIDGFTCDRPAQLQAWSQDPAGIARYCGCVCGSNARMDRQSPANLVPCWRSPAARPWPAAASAERAGGQVTR